VAVEFGQIFGTGGSPSSNVYTYAGQATISTSWARYSVTVAVPSISGKTIGTDANSSYLELGLWTSAGSDFNSRTGSIGIQLNAIDFWGVQVENGNVSTSFQTATGTLQGELAACQRYYQRTSGNQFVTVGGWGSAINTTNVRFQFPNKVTMRVYPTAVDFGTIAVTPDATASAIAVTTLTLVSNSDPDSVILNAALTGATQYRPYQLYLNASPSFIGVSAEL
jgi:hypothetical protein